MSLTRNFFVAGLGFAGLLAAPAVGHAVAGGHQQPKYLTSCYTAYNPHLPCWTSVSECDQIAAAKNDNPHPYGDYYCDVEENSGNWKLNQRI